MKGGGSGLRLSRKLAMKAYTPQIRIISVEHDRTMSASTLLRHAFDAQGLKHYPIINVFCHLEAGRCGVQSGMVAVEVDGSIVWAGKELTARMAEDFCVALQNYAKKQEQGL